MNEDKDEWLSYWNGNLSLHAMFQLYDTKMCMLALERFDHMPLPIYELQRDLFDMH